MNNAFVVALAAVQSATSTSCLLLLANCKIIKLIHRLCSQSSGRNPAFASQRQVACCGWTRSIILCLIMCISRFMLIKNLIIIIIMFNYAIMAVTQNNTIECTQASAKMKYLVVHLLQLSLLWFGVGCFRLLSWVWAAVTWLSVCSRCVLDTVFYFYYFCFLFFYIFFLFSCTLCTNLW